MDIVLEPLTQLKAVTVIKEIPTDGHSPLLVIASNYESYYAKSCKRIPDFTILSEFLCHYFLKCWQIDTPDIAAIKINADQLIPGLSIINNNPRNFETICFGSKQIKDAIDVQDFISADNKAHFKKIRNSEVVFRLALFDIWIENDDRKPTNNNLILSSSESEKSIVAIDHSYVFSTLSYDHLDPALGITSSYNDSILLSEIGRSVVNKTTINDDWVNDIEEKFYLYIENCKKHYDEIAAFIPAELGFSDQLKKYISYFLFDENRNSEVFKEFISRL